MKKLLISSVLAFMSCPSFSSPVTCSAKHVFTPSSTDQYDVQIEKTEKSFDITINGISQKIIKSVRSDFSKIGEVLKFNMNDESFSIALQNYLDDKINDEYLYHSHAEIFLIQSYIEMLKAPIKLDIYSIASGNRYFFTEPTKYGSSGFSEFFDREGKHLGYALMMNEELMECN